MAALRPLRSTQFLASLAGLAAFATLLLLTACTTTQPSPPTNPRPAAADQPLRVGINPTMPPIAFKEGGQLAGLEADLARGFAEHLGRRVEFVEMAWVDLLPALQRGRVDIVMSGMSITPERAAIVDFTPAYLNSGLAVLLRRDRESALGYFFNAKVRLGVKPGTTGDYFVQQEHPRNPVKRFRDPREAAEAVQKGSIEVFFIDAPVAWYLAGQFESRGLTASTTLLTTEALAWAVRKGDVPLLDSATEYLELIRQNGAKTAIMRRWLGAMYAPAK
jgi:ABC-type amino acid transport substrate-binding protein